MLWLRTPTDLSSNLVSAIEAICQQCNLGQAMSLGFLVDEIKTTISSFK